jgi:hypothetical protein
VVRQQRPGEAQQGGRDAKLRPADKPTFTAESAGASPDAANRELGHWALTTRERKRILLDNIHGVDIDYQAVEVTKLSLLLRCLEGETAESLRGFMTLFRERALPDLGRNIQCGNSLIGTDITITDAWREMSEEQRQRINPFDYERAFPQVFKQGGFDAVIGNPPYYKVSGRTDPLLYRHYAEQYQSAGFKTELYALFAEQAVRLLCPNGLHSFIVPNSFLAGVYLKPLRDLLGDQNTLLDLVLLKDVKVFEDAKLDSVVYVIRRHPPDPQSRFIIRTSDISLKTESGIVLSIELDRWRQTSGREFRVVQSRVPGDDRALPRARPAPEYIRLGSPWASCWTRTIACSRRRARNRRIRLSWAGTSLATPRSSQRIGLISPPTQLSAARRTLRCMPRGHASSCKRSAT